MIVEILLAYGGGVVTGYAIFKPRPDHNRRLIAPVAVHEAMQNAPHDGQPFRQARAAIRAFPRCPCGYEITDGSEPHK